MSLEIESATVQSDADGTPDTHARGATPDDPDVLFELGNRHACGAADRVNIRQALDLWRRAAAHGSSAAMYGLGIAYLNGEGVVQSYPHAIKWLLLAVTCDHPESTEALREMKGDVTADDHEEGFRLMQEWVENPASRLQ